MAEGLGEEQGPVAEGAEHDAGVDEGEVVRGEGPGGFEIVDLVADVGGGPAGLDGGEVDAVDCGGGVGVGDVFGPDACNFLLVGCLGECSDLFLPVPVPASRTLSSLATGAKKGLSSKASLIAWYCRSMRFCSSSSFGRAYRPSW